jgi:hypothetical protein
MAWVCQKAGRGKKQCNEKRAQYVLDGGNNKNSPVQGLVLVLLPMASAVKNLSERVRLTKAICGCVEDAECRCPWRDVLRVPFDNRKVGKGHLGGGLHLSSGSTCCFQCPWNMYLLAGTLSSSCPHVVVSSWNQVVLSRRGAPA